MWSFSTFLEEDLINFLERGLLDEELGQVIKQFEYLTPSVQLSLVRHLRSVRYEPEKLSKELGIRKSTAEAILYNPMVEFEFPAVSVSDGKLIKAVAILDTPESFCNVGELRRYLKPVEEYLRNKGRISKHLGVIFDHEITGNSFQLALTLSILMEKLPEGLCWSGGVRKNGKITRVDSMVKKAQVCRKFNKRLADPFHLDSVDQLHDWLNKSFIDVPIFISKSKNSVEEFFKDRNTLLNLQHIHGIDVQRLLIYTDKLEGEGWKRKMEEFANLLKELDYYLQRRVRAHIAVNGPASLAFATGILYGHTRPSAIYHYNQGEKRYFPIELQNTREVKEHVREYRFVRAKFTDRGGKDLAVVLFFAHHTPEADVLSFLEREGINADILLLTTEEGRGNINPENFKTIARESASMIQETKGKKSYENFHFFFSCPVAVAYLLGVAYGHYDSGYIYNRDEGYTRVLSLGFIRELIESLKQNHLSEL